MPKRNAAAEHQSEPSRSVKVSYNFPEAEIQAIREIAAGNATTDTEVMRRAMQLFVCLGKVGVGKELIIRVPQPDKKQPREFGVLMYVDPSLRAELEPPKPSAPKASKAKPTEGLVRI